MEKGSKIYVAGHGGLVGSAVVCALRAKGYNNVLTISSKELDLRRQTEVETFFDKEQPEYVFLAAAKVGGIFANSTYKAEFLYDNLAIALNVIHSSYLCGVKKLLNLGSSCIYPKFAPQPMKEEYLLTGVLEPTNEPYAIAKISAIKLCRYYNEQYGTNFISVMPSNLYGPNDNFNLETSHVFPAMIRKMHLGKCIQNGDFESIRNDLKKYPLQDIDIAELKDVDIVNLLSNFGIKTSYRHNSSLLTMVEIWGSGEPYREFLYVDDLADACVFLMENYDFEDMGEFVNVGTGTDIKIKDVAKVIADIIGFAGEIRHDTTKPDGTPRKLLYVDKLKKLGWIPKTLLEQGIEKTYKWYSGIK